MELRWNKLSADVAFQMSKHLSPHKQAQGDLQAEIQDVQGTFLFSTAAW